MPFVSSRWRTVPSLPTSQKTYVWLSTPGTENLLLHGKFYCYSPCCLHLFLLTDHCFFFLCFVSVSKLPNLSQKSNVAERLQYYKESWTFRNTFLLSMPQSLSKIIHQMRSKRWGLLKTCLSTIAKFILFLV